MFLILSPLSTLFQHSWSDLFDLKQFHTISSSSFDRPDQRCQADEIARLQASIEEYTNRLTISQKRVEEREMRLKKLENENVSSIQPIVHVCKRLA